MEEEQDLFTQLLELLSPLLMPAWDDLIGLLPLAMLGLALLLLLVMALPWLRSSGRNRSRVAPRRTPVTPPGIHLPGPSPWPLVAPVGGALVLLSLVFGGGGLPVQPILFGLGLAVAVVGIGGWYLDANREWRRTEVGAHDLAVREGTHGTLITARAAAVPSWAIEPPPGIHMPGPSAWPFFAPIALGFVFLGLIFGPVLLVGGLLMALIAVAGWYFDAGREYRQVEAGHLPEPVTRDPERAFPKVLLPVYATIAAGAIALTLLPAGLAMLPGSGAPDDAPGGGGAPVAPSPDAAPEIAAETATEFTTDRLVVAAGTGFELTFDNRQEGVPHNVWINQGDATVFQGEDITGPETIVYQVPALEAGEYTFICSIHPPMTGTLLAE
jgi:plastocyanin